MPGCAWVGSIPAEVANLAAWLRTVVTRICLDMLRSRPPRRDELELSDQVADPAQWRQPEDEALLADSVSRALLLVAIMAMLAPDVVRRVDPVALPPGVAAEVRGARPVAEGTVALAGRSRHAELALVNGTVGVVVAPRGRLLLALTFVISKDKIIEYEVIADPRGWRG